VPGLIQTKYYKEETYKCKTAQPYVLENKHFIDQ